MKYKLLRLSLLSMLVMFFGGLAFAQNETIDFSTLGYDNAAEVTTVQGTDVTLTFDKGTNNNTPKYYTTGAAVRLYGGSTLKVSSSTKTIEKVVFTFNSSSYNLNDPTVDEGSYDSETSTWTGSASEFTITRGGTSGHARIQKMEFYYAAGGETDNRLATTLTLGDYQTTGVVGKAVNLPTVTVQDASGTPVENVEIEWTSSNTDVATITDGIINFNAAGTTTIKASFAGDNSYKGSSASFTLTVTAAPYTSIAAMLADITSTKTTVTYQFENLLVTYVNGSNTFVSDGRNGFLFYGANLGLNAGEQITGTATGQIYTYNGLPEMAVSADGISAQVVSEGNLVAWPTIPAADLQSYINIPVTIENAVYVEAGSGKNLTFKVGDETLAVYNNWSIDVTALEADKSYTLTGVGSVYVKNETTTYQLYLVSFEEKAEEEGYVYRDFAVNLTDANSIPTTSNSFGVKVAEDGTYTAVAADDEAANFTVSAARFNDAQHGWVNCTFTVPVQGAVKIELGDCQFGGQNGTITDGNGNVIDIKANATKKCWSANAPHDNVVVDYYAGVDPTTLTIFYNGYCPFIAVTAIDPADIPNEATLTFDVANAGAEGVAPAPQKVEIGSVVTIPANTSLYKEGYTLTAWTDGTAEYAAGQEFNVTEDVTLTPVFTENAASFADRTAETTITWQFGEANGAGTLNAQGKKTILVAQATIGEAVIDVKMNIDATNGKINNVGRGDKWAQCTDGTVLTIPAYKGTAVSFDSYSDGTGTTIGGVEAADKAATYEGTAETLDIVAKGMRYIASVTAVYPVPTGDEPVKVDVNVAFSIEGAECEGQLVAEGGTYKSGDDFTLPAKNFTLYKEGFTQTGWTDGENTYEMGKVVSLPETDVTFSPVFTQNEVSLADRTEAVTVKFDFQRQNGAPTVAYQNKTGIWVAQATIGNSVIDVKADFDTNNGGKFANGNWSDWAQLNGGTKWTIPSCKGATVSVEAFNELGTGDTPLTIDGQSDYTQGKTISYTIAGSAETVDVVIGKEGSYYRYIQVVLPVVQSQGGGESYENATATVNWPLNDSGNVAAYTATPDGAFSTVAVNTGDLEITGVGTRSADDAAQGVTFVKFKPSGSTQAVEWVVKPAAGLTFTPTQISLWIQRFSTDAQNGVTVSAKVGEGEAVTLGNYTAPRANQDTTKDKYAGNSNYTNQVVINLTEDQQAALTSGEALTLTATVGVGSSKEGGFSDVVINGLVNGTKADVELFTLATVVAPEEAGSINVYPVSEQYEAGSDVKLTATENFGYDFVNWTDQNGEVVSEEPVFTYTMTADATLTANFVAVETYELALTVDGTNDYMVTVNPAPTVVDGKNMYEAGATVVLTANQYEGLVTFTNWSDGMTNSEMTVTMDADKDITASYAQADIIAGWDFYKAGGSGRKADFAAQDNDADALSLVNTKTGETSGWLDKSTLGGGGYESFKGAAVNWRTGSQNGDVGNWHWQTKVNAEAFTDINVQFQMLYNYNAYQTYDAEYSLDGENWTKFGSITMTGTKQAVQFSEQLPAEANNQAALYIRMLADKTSNVDGAASANDGNTLAMFFITGTPKLVNDGVAPVLVSTVPENGATGASASGKIVLTFDERVKVAEGATATLAAQTLTPAVSGKTVTFEYKGLDYSTEYTFTLPANSVADLTDNYIADPISLSFTTMARPTVTKGLYDAVVEDVDQLMAAINEAAARADKNVRYRIFIKNGEYTIPLASTIKTVNGYEVPECITFLNTSNVSFIGESRDGVIITNGIDKSETFAGQYGTASKYDGIGNSDVFQIGSSASGLYWQDLTVETGMDDATGRDIAIQDKGTMNIYKNVGLSGYQDTWTSNNDNGLYYFEDGYVRGRTDYMCGKGDIFWNRVELRQIAGGYAAVPSKPAKYGWIYKDCVINGEGSGVDGNYTLGRPWGSGTPIALFIDTKMNVVPSAIGWNEMSGGWPARFAEYNSMTSTGSVIDLSGRKKTFGDGHENNPVLTAEEALENSNLHRMFGDWDPTLATEQAPVPTNVKVSGKQLIWDDNNYTLLYAVCKDGKVIDFTTEAQYAVSDEGEYTVRAANEMGGLSEASAVASFTTGIENVEPTEPVSADDTIYNLQGVRVNKATKGLYIVNGRKVVIK